MPETPTTRCKSCHCEIEMFNIGDDRCALCSTMAALLPEYINRTGLQFIRQHLPKLDDWTEGKPGWNYEAILHNNDVTVEWQDTLVNCEDERTPAPPDLCGWGFHWKNGAIFIGQTTEAIARQAAALFVSLWLRGVSASFCDKLMDGFIIVLERQENMLLTFLGEVDYYSHGGKFLRLTREGLCHRESFEYDAERKIIAALDPQPDEEIIVTFTKRKKSP